ncbi:unnamed protein product, partial [Coregonus sp. 'balchen']
MPSHKTNSTSTTLTPTIPTQKRTSSTSLPTIVEDTPQEESDPWSPPQPARPPQPCQLHASPQPPEQPPTDSGTGTDQPHPSSPNSTPSSPEETLAEIVLLMDSNGKFVQENKLFPKHKTRKRQHPGTAPWTPQPRPQHHQPQCPPHPAQHRPPQPSFRPTQTRPNTPLPPTADPHLEEPQPGRQSYGQAVTGPAPTNEMSDIKQMLNLLCSHVIGRGS